MQRAGKAGQTRAPRRAYLSGAFLRAAAEVQPDGRPSEHPAEQFDAKGRLHQNT